MRIEFFGKFRKHGKFSFIIAQKQKGKKNSQNVGDRQQKGLQAQVHHIQGRDWKKNEKKFHSESKILKISIVIYLGGRRALRRLVLVCW